MLYYYHFKCILTLITLITLTLILNLALTFSLTLSRIVHSSVTSFHNFVFHHFFSLGAIQLLRKTRRGWGCHPNAYSFLRGGGGVSEIKLKVN